MGKILFIFFLLSSTILASVSKAASAAAAQSTIDLAVQLAMNSDEKKLVGQGSMSCRYELGEMTSGSNQLKAFGKDIQQATNRLGLLCIKLNCARVGEMISESLQKMSSVSDTDMSDFSKAQGYPQQEIAQILAKRKATEPSEFKALTCLTAVPMAKTVIVESCFSQPISCQTH